MEHLKINLYLQRLLRQCILGSITTHSTLDSDSLRISTILSLADSLSPLFPSGRPPFSLFLFDSTFCFRPPLTSPFAALPAPLSLSLSGCSRQLRTNERTNDHTAQPTDAPIKLSKTVCMNSQAFPAHVPPLSTDN